MIRVFLTRGQFSGSRVTPSESDYHHLVRVLRVQPGDPIEWAIDGQELVLGTVTDVSKSSLDIRIESRSPLLIPVPVLTLCQSLPKQDKFSEILRKCAEMGVIRFVPFLSERSEFKAVRANSKAERWRSILREAAMQSRQPHPPDLEAVTDLSGVIHHIRQAAPGLAVVFWEEAAPSEFLKAALTRHPAIQTLWMVIGPEGGFSAEEIQQLETAGCVRASLGPTVLRVENAGLAAAAMARYHYFS